MDGLNSPVAIVAILAGCAVVIREATWVVKNRNGSNPIQKAMDRQTEMFREQKEMFERVFLRQDVILDKINEKINLTHNLLERCHDKLNEQDRA